MDRYQCGGWWRYRGGPLLSPLPAHRAVLGHLRPARNTDRGRGGHPGGRPGLEWSARRSHARYPRSSQV